ncbi:MAG: radical SAM protein [Desulfobacteraceae bacterium]|nr:radical SAM protein [Desulfobacteraceae bacterium]
MSKSTQKEKYTGFEQGPIRPPSEAYSLLIRVTRNCPWNKCKFCPVYKESKFSLRPVEHVKKDIDAVYKHIKAIRDMSDASGQILRENIDAYVAKLSGSDNRAFQAALQWYAGGMESVFLQDANSMIIKPHELIGILSHLKNCFPWVVRITTYARSRTVSRIGDEDLKAIANAGLNRIHIGMESGSDEVLTMMRKGTTKEQHIMAGQKVVAAGMQLSEYVMPGLGGRSLSRTHALESADALNQINPDYIRLRTLAIPNRVPLFEDYKAGRFEKLTDLETIEEILLFLDHLEGIESKVRSDHILNLFEEIEGTLPYDKDKMTGVIKRFLSMDPHDRMLYQVGRRLGHLRRIDDLEDSRVRRELTDLCSKNGITPENINDVTYEVMKRFI